MRRPLLVLALLPLAAFADDDHDDRERRGQARGLASAVRATPGWALYEEECGACHLAYAPGMLPKRSWSALVNGLADHFGQNAELELETRQELGAWLARWAAESGSDRRSFKFLATSLGSTPLRITDVPYWRKKHHEVQSAVFARRSVGSRANCSACHGGADQGEFDDDTVKIPKDAPAPR